MAFTYDKIRERTAKGGCEAAQVTGYEGRLRDLVVPSELDGLPVRSIAGHAFEHRKELRSASLPESVKTLRSFAFYGCTNLASLELFNTTDDYYDGVIRQCPSLRFVTVHCVVPDNFMIVREMLRDVDSTLSFRLFTAEGEVRLTFPEYVNEAKEDTMARAIHFSIEGAGMAYRECVGRRELDLFAYDQLLGRLTDYDFDVASRIALGRLACPVRLAKRSEKGYEDFLRDNDVKALEGLIAGKGTAADSAVSLSGAGGAAIMGDGGSAVSADREIERRESLQTLIARRLIGKEALEAGLELAASGGRTELCSVLMDYRSRVFPEGNKTTFTLNW